MGFTGHVNDKYLKSLFNRPYKFLVHCVVHALSHRKGAYNETSDYIMNIITCLVLNRPYNISQVLFDHMVDNISSETYIMYPRFIQMMIEDQVTNLSKDPADVMNLRNMKVETLSRLGQYKLKKDETKPRAKHMICKIANPGYVAPDNDAWKHENNNSENEDDRLRDMHEKKLRYWFVKDGKRKRTPKTSPTLNAPKVSTPKIVVKGIVERGSHKKRPSKKSSQRLIDETVIPPTEITQEGIDLTKVTFEQYIQQTEVAEKAAKKVESSAKHVEPKSMKEKEPEGVVHSYSSDADDESTETESEIEKIVVGKVQLKKKPQIKKAKGSNDEDETYVPTPQAEKKKFRIKRKAVQSGVIPRNVRAKKGGATMPEVQSVKCEKHVRTSKGPEVVKDQNVEVPKVPEVQSIEKPEAEKEKARESPKYVRVEKKDDAEYSKPKKTSLPDLF
ncbi:hypothetical protein Hanom_Chr03g00190141 [Helianthus anomalus]